MDPELEFQIEVKTHNRPTAGAKPAPQPTPVLDPVTKTSGIIASWGEDNLRPQNIIDALEKFPELKQIIEWKANALYSGGIIYGTVTYDADGNEILKPVKDKVVEQFFRQTNINRYLIESCHDFYWFYNVFPHILLDERNKIYSMQVKHAALCRFGLQNTKGVIDRVYYAADWRQGYKPDNTKEYISIDPYYDAFNQVTNFKGPGFIYPLSYSSTEEIYYQKAPWHNVLESDWLGTASAIPTYKKAMFENQMSLVYKITISLWYLKEVKYIGLWDKAKPEQKKAWLDDIKTSITETLTGASNAGKSIIDVSRLGPDGKPEHAVTIEVVENKIKTGTYVEDSEEAYGRLYAALGINQALVGFGRGKSAAGGGSGTDQGVAYNIYMMNTKPHADIILEPLNLARDINGWNPEYVFMFRNYYIATRQHRQGVSKDASNPNN